MGYARGVAVLGLRALGLVGFMAYVKTFCTGAFFSVAEWIHFTLFGIIFPTTKLKV